MRILSKLAMTVLLCVPFGLQAADLPGLRFSHHDWELSCDNTRTCRAAGYQSDSDERAVSVLLTRKAGPAQPVKGEIMIGNYGDDQPTAKLPAVFKLAMRINGKNAGVLRIDQKTFTADLSAAQVDALLAALRHDSKIEWASDDIVWRLSDQGAAAILLKMDAFQGRVGTIGALVKKGAMSEDGVRRPLPVPVLVAPALPKPLPSDKKLFAKTGQALRAALQATLGEEACSGLEERKMRGSDLFVARLTATKVLVSAPCWMAAYNSGDGYWVVNDTPPFQPVLVTADGSDFGDGSISIAQKGRGLGDCWSTAAWAWDGRQFVQTDSATSGMCRLVAPGGAWSLPVLVTEVRRAAAQ